MRKIFFIAYTLLSLSLFAQKDTLVVDQIVARVGDEIILQSDVEAQYYQMLANGNSASRTAKCKVLEDQLIQKLLINQAKIDSLTVSDDEVNMQVDARVDVFVQQLGGIAELEKYLNKSIFDIKKDLAKMLQSQLLAQKEQAKITDDVKITPSEVADYYATIPQDSIPLVDVSYQISQIILYPILTKAEKQITIDKMNDLRDKIISGTRKFESLARMYSQDNESAKNGGELGFVNRGDLDPVFAAAAFRLKKDEVSPVIKSQFGYHIIQMIERRGEKINVRHILIREFIPNEAKQRTIAFADSIRNLIVSDSISFKNAAMRFSNDPDTKNNGGLLYNQMTGNSEFKINELPPYIKYDVIKLNEGEISKPISSTNKKGNEVIKIYKIVKKTPQHVANLNDDYQLFYDNALAHKKSQIFENWVEKQQKQVYISIIPEYTDCTFKFKNWLKN